MLIGIENVRGTTRVSEFLSGIEVHIMRIITVTTISDVAKSYQLILMIPVLFKWQNVEYHVWVTNVIWQDSRLCRPTSDTTTRLAATPCGSSDNTDWYTVGVVHNEQ